MTKVLNSVLWSVLALTTWAGMVAAQEKGADKGNGDFNVPGKKEDDAPAPTHSKNLDTKNIEVTALYLNRVSIKLQQLSAEAERTGNAIKYEEYKETIEAELAKWKGVTITWAVQVASVNKPDAPFGYPITPVNEYLFKNKARLLFGFDPFANGGGIRQQNVEYSEEWARTLRRGDYMIVEGQIDTINIGGIGRGGVGFGDGVIGGPYPFPRIIIKPEKLSKQPVAKKK